ncbi:MAG: class I poly(R)-hydroxyalkanoic acid synthase [Alphaproteobacteria bacterium]|nr:class I poly(R)-hydroxyalkanoic acid synthase [Alphaproteobacteria bacterium]
MSERSKERPKTPPDTKGNEAKPAAEAKAEAKPAAAKAEAKPAAETAAKPDSKPAAAKGGPKAEPKTAAGAADAKPPDIKFPDPVEWSRTWARVAEQSQRMVTEFLTRRAAAASGEDSMGMADPLNVGSAFLEMAARMMADPARLVQAQMSLWSDYMSLWQNATRRFLGGEPTTPMTAPEAEDRRFKDSAWNENVVFDFIKQSYLLTARWMQSNVRHVEGLDDKTAKKLDFYTRQFVDAMAPTNFLATNPEVLRTTLESGGENLLKGLNHMLDDLERGHGQLSIKMTDLEAFKIGQNIAVTPGKVVFQNDLMQLIQYEPTTKEVYKRPLLIIPPWINKYYILDLREKNSFVKWAVDQGITVFMVSWVNPGEELADKSFEDYMVECPLAALDAIQAATGEPDCNVIGYCLGGTLLASTLAYMTSKNDKRIASATYFAAMVDFAETGEISVFIDEEQLHALEERMSKHGYLDGRAMSTTFNMLRANDLIWSFVVNNYLLGKEPFPFDLLYWNSDSTRMPAAMHSFYLRKMYQENKLSEPNGITLKGVPIDVTQITTPTFILASREDHIAPWKTCYVSTQLFKGPVRFVLAASGHIAGVVNPPAAQKYCHWVGDAHPKDPEQWLKAAEQRPGSWWPEWASWLAQYGNGKVPARVPGSGKLKVLEAAPGSYVQVTAA